MIPRMKQWFTAVMAIAMVALLLPWAMAVPETSPPPGSGGPTKAPPAFRSDVILVKPKAGVSASKLAKLHGANKAKVKRAFARFGNLQVLELPKGSDVPSAVRNYKKSGLVEYAEPDYIMRSSATPDDPYYLDGSLWGLHNTGQDGGTSDADIDAPEGWDTSHDASDVVVAVIDTGVNYEHEDLAANMWTNPGEIPGNSIDDDNNGYVDDVYGINAIDWYGTPGDPMDDCGHGTHVAGMIGAVGNNDTGVARVAWQTKIMACKFLDNGGSGSTSDAITCIDYALGMGAKVVNASWGSTYPSQALEGAIDGAGFWGGIIFVAAAGNSGNNADNWPEFPAACSLDNIVSVGATDRNDALASFSNYGAECVDIAAPGVDIMSTWYDGSYCELSGTSMAAPHVSGAVALLRQMHPSESYVQIINRLLGSAEPIASMTGKCVSGGRLNLDDALSYTPPALYVTPTSTCRFGGPVGGYFTPYELYFTLTISGGGTWSASNTESWLTLQNTSGNGSATVEADITTDANLLPAGLYYDTITFTLGSQTVTRQVVLQVGPIHVSPNGNDANDGYSWANAKQTIQAGIDTASGQQVWVEAGTYVENLQLKADVSIIGGFDGTETDFSQRDLAANKTILDGNKSGSVIRVATGYAGGMIDGFTIQNGTGYSPGWNHYGGGIYCPNASPTITHNIITRNDNQAMFGGGIYCDNGEPFIANNVITANIGGAIYLDYSPAVIVNNTITSNSGGNKYASAYYFAFGSGGILAYGCSPLVANNIIAFNTSGVSIFSEDDPRLSYNCVFGNTCFDYAGVTDPTGTDGNISVDPGLANYQYGDVHLLSNSPCRNAGDSEWQYQMISEGDIDSQSRVQGTGIDMGADESNGETYANGPNVIVRVKPDGSDSNDGSSWTLAKQTVQAAIDAASAEGGEVWVKSGTYDECITIPQYAYVYGGFCGTETAKSQRDWVSNLSILDAQQNGRVVDVQSAHMLGCIDGFTIRNGRSMMGAGVFCYISSAAIANNKISGNTAIVSEYQAGGWGGGIYTCWSAPTITNNVITGNTAPRRGAGLHVSLASPTISGNIITDNTVDLTQLPQLVEQSFGC